MVSHLDRKRAVGATVGMREREEREGKLSGTGGAFCRSSDEGVMVLV